MERAICDLCSADDPLVLYSGKTWMHNLPDEISLVRCRNCGLMYLNPRPGPDEMDKYYPADYRPYRLAIEDEHWGLMRWMRRRKLAQRRKWIEQYSSRKSGCVLDVGCATGLFLHEMVQAGWEGAGIEPNASAAEYARTRLGLNVFQGMLELAPYPPQSFDVLTFWDVLEHTYSPSGTLARSADLLRPGGLLVINIPNWHSPERRLFARYWSGFDPPRHLYVFTRPTLLELMNKFGFRPLGWECFMPSYYSSVISLDFWLQTISPNWAARVGKVLNFPGMRFAFEPWFTLTNWLKISGSICLFAQKRA